MHSVLDGDECCGEKAEKDVLAIWEGVEGEGDI